MLNAPRRLNVALPGLGTWQGGFYELMELFDDLEEIMGGNLHFCYKRPTTARSSRHVLGVFRMNGSFRQDRDQGLEDLVR